MYSVDLKRTLALTLAVASSIGVGASIARADYVSTMGNHHWHQGPISVHSYLSPGWAPVLWRALLVYNRISHGRYNLVLTAGPGEIDVLDGDYGLDKTWDGQTNYEQWDASHFKHATILLNNTYLRNDLSMLDKVICHELGHALGLGHRAIGDRSCMTADQANYAYPDQMDEYTLQLLFREA